MYNKDLIQKGCWASFLEIVTFELKAEEYIRVNQEKERLGLRDIPG